MTILEAVEHNTATPDVIEVEIISAVKGVVEKAVAEDRPDSSWTKEILVAVGALGKRHGYYRCGPGGDQGGWLFDYVWIDNKRDSMPLVLECEWGPADVMIDDDFQKLRVARADHRVMIFQGGDLERHFDRMANDVRSFAYTQHGYSALIGRRSGSSLGCLSRKTARTEAKAAGEPLMPEAGPGWTSPLA